MRRAEERRRLEHAAAQQEADAKRLQEMFRAKPAEQHLPKADVGLRLRDLAPLDWDQIRDQAAHAIIRGPRVQRGDDALRRDVRRPGVTHFRLGEREVGGLDWAEHQNLDARATQAALDYGYIYRRPCGPPVPPWMRGPDPDAKPYEWWKRLPALDRSDPLQDALSRACRRLHPAWKECYTDAPFRLAEIGWGAFRTCFDVLTHDGFRSGLVVKRPRDGRRSGDIVHDNGNGTECLIYLHVAATAPHLLPLFPILFETAPDAGWAIHERVIIGSMGVEGTRSLAERLREGSRIATGDIKGGNIGRHPSRYATVFADYGHFDRLHDDGLDYLPADYAPF